MNPIQLTLLRAQPEGGNAKSFIFSAPEDFSWIAGQAQAYYLAAAGTDTADNQRWFTISSAPSEHEVRITTRLSGSNFKRSLDCLGPGDTIVAYGPGGDFTWQDDAAVVLVAGGIGITPFRSMLRERALRGRPLDATLVYASRDSDVIFREELDDLEGEHQELKVIHLIGESLTAARILELAPEARQLRTYLSGPEPMVQSVGDELKKAGVADLRQDWLPGYTETTG